MRAKQVWIGVAVASLITSAVASAPVSAGPSGGALPPQLVKVLRVAGRHGIPADASMVAANVTVAGPAEPGYLTVYPCDAAEPDTSNVNYFTDQVVPNLVLSRVSTDGTICIATSAVTDVIVDLVGYVPAGASVTPLDVPLRRLDTRAPGGPASPVAAGSVTEIEITGRDGVPDDVTVVMFNATAIAGTEPGYLTAYPCGERPETSSVNYQPGQVVPNLVVSRVSATGAVCIYNLSRADFVIDLAAYATDGIIPLTAPERLVDTRDDGGIGPAGTTLRIDISARPDVPDDATAAVYNLTSVDATAPGYATSYPCDAARPTVSNLNYSPGRVTANGTITKLSAAGELCIYQLAPTNLVVDLIGYTRDDTHYAPITPRRILDSRAGWQRTCDWVVRANREDRTALMAFNLRDGRAVRLDLPDGGLAGFDPTVDVDCAGVWVLRDNVSTNRGLFHIGFDGSRTRTSFRGDTTGGEVRQLANGDIVLLTVYGELRSLPDGESISPQIFTGPASDPDASFIDQAMSDDAQTFASVYSLDRGETTWFDTYTRDGARLARRRIAGRYLNIDMSPDGTYVAVSYVGEDNSHHVTVYTLFGDPVDGVYGGAGFTPTFTGDGELALCVTTYGLYQWQLFGPIDELAGYPHPFFPELAGPSCEAFSR